MSRAVQVRWQHHVAMHSAGLGNTLLCVHKQTSDSQGPAGLLCHWPFLVFAPTPPQHPTEQRISVFPGVNQIESSWGGTLPFWTRAQL